MEYLILYANCIPVKGESRSTICDLQRNQYWFIPNELYDILAELNHLSISQTKNYFENENDDILDEYFNFLIINEIGFLGTFDEIKYFPKINPIWDDSSRITNSIIDSNINSNHDFKIIFKQLEMLGCKYLQLRFFDAIDLSFLDSTLDNLELSRIISVEVILPHSSHGSGLAKLIERHNRLTQIVFYGADSIKSSTLNHTNILYVSEKINSEKHCGQISSKFFSINIKNYTESVNYNSCLNRKISIDCLGEIKNCPSMQKSFGNIKRKTLNDILLNDDFKSVWALNKDKIDVCKKCEFRHICTDCRAYLEHPNDSNSKPLKCGYNPVTCEWGEWDTNPLKEESIKHYDLKYIK